MEKVLEIDGRKVVFKTSGAFFMRYKQQFKRDPIKDIMNLNDAVNSKDEESADLLDIDTEILFNLCWCLAKTANPNILPPLEWLDSFEEFPVFDIIGEVMELVVSSMTTSNPLKKTQKMEK